MAQEDRELALANACMVRRVQFQTVRCPFDTLEKNRMAIRGWVFGPLDVGRPRCYRLSILTMSVSRVRREFSDYHPEGFGWASWGTRVAGGA
jgi:hypothetical protein